MNMLRLVQSWAGLYDPPQTSLPASFVRTAFELNCYGLYTKDEAKPGTAACEIVRHTLKRLNLGLNPERGEPTNSRTLFSRVYSHPARRFIVNDQGGVAIFTELATANDPEELTACMILAQAQRPADHLLEAHEYTPVFCLTGRCMYEEDRSYVMVVKSLHQQLERVSTTDINTKLAVCYADLCFSQLLAGKRMDPDEALKIVDKLSLLELDARFTTMKSRAIGSAHDYPAIRPALSYGVK